ncbi:MAG: hypothetical protein Q9N68_08010 [Gammaproteobacteria bacterium]|nr:hypothetical protein [Gammaproteobacteria bacterium]
MNSVKIVAGFLLLLLMGCDGGTGSGGGSSSAASTGQAGSMSRFSLNGNKLYAITQMANSGGANTVQLFDITDPAAPTPWSQLKTSFGIETLFSVDNRLYIGAMNGMHIYDITDPAFPQLKGSYTHATACDPVVVQGIYAFVTLRSTAGAGRCWGNQNQLDVVDIADATLPTLARSYPMQSPKGLAIAGTTLFVCDDVAGLKVLDVTDPLNISTIEVRAEINCYDLIADNGTLIVSSKTGVYQYDYTVSPIVLLSEIPLAVN